MEDPLKMMINRHTQEDGSHWKMYLRDLNTLDLDLNIPLSKTLSMLFGEQTKVQRSAIYRLAQFAEIAKDPLERYCIIETIEIFGHYLFELIKDLSREYTKETGKTLLYLGELHFEREPGVLANQKGSTTQEEVLNMDLSEETRQKMMPIILEVSELIEARWHEFFVNAQNRTQRTLINSLH